MEKNVWGHFVNNWLKNSDGFKIIEIGNRKVVIVTYR